jgi:putative transposase
MKAAGKLNKTKDNDLRKELTQLKQTEEYCWLYDVSNNIGKQAVKDACSAIDRFHRESAKHGYRYKVKAIKSGKELDFTDFEDFPRFKSKKKSKTSFYHDTEKLKVYGGSVHLEKIGKVELAEHDRIPADTKYTNPRITHDGKYWYISVGVEQETQKPESTGETIGIDLGIKEMAIVSSLDAPIENINKTAEVRRLKKKLKRKQRQVSKKYDKNKIQIGKAGENRYKFTKTKNIERLEKETRLINRRLGNIRLNHIHQATNMIVKTKPSRIVVEDLNVKGMMKNRHLSKAIAEQCFGMFVIILAYKCLLNGIELVRADRFYPSSKKCSRCGEIKKDLKLKDRVFICPKCGFTLDRDKNASINLAGYVA